MPDAAVGGGWPRLNRSECGIVVGRVGCFLREWATARGGCVVAAVGGGWPRWGSAARDAALRNAAAGGRG